MTFILNVLHKDYSLLAADRRGKSTGPVSMTSGKLTINAPAGTVIEGIRKIRVSQNGRQALAFAGETEAHGYLEAFQEAASAEQALEAIGTHIASRFSQADRGKKLRAEPTMENHVIATFFDAERQAFFTSFHGFSDFANACHLDARALNPRPAMWSGGSGGACFEKAVGVQEIGDFISRLEKGLSADERLAWLAEAFRKVSAIDAGSGPELEAVLATNESPGFVFLRMGTGFSMSPSKPK